MELGAALLVVLVIGLGLFEAWLLWFVRREHARLDHRIDESLDDEDLTQFQEGLQGLLTEVREAGRDLVATLEKRQASLEKSTDKAKETESKLMVRLQAMEKLVDGVAKRLEQAEDRAAQKTQAGAKDSAKERAKKPPVHRPGAKPAPPRATEPSEPAPLSARVEPEEPNRSYLVRPQAAPTAPNRHQRVYDLADQGLSREAIARETRILPGEIDLILNLRQQRGSKD